MLEASRKQRIKKPLIITHKHKLTFAYLVLLLLPFVIAESLGMLSKGVYSSILGMFNLLAMMAFFVQFPLAGRLKQWPMFANIDWAVSLHKKWGKYLGIFFFLHPLLIVAPKLLVSVDDTLHSINKMITSEHLLTGILAWVAMFIWVLMSIYKDKLKLSYERWRLLHLLGFIVIATLATLHVTSIGSHGQFQHNYNGVWWGLYSFCMAMLIYNYVIKPRAIQASPFTLQSLQKVSERDWRMRIATQQSQPFAFQAGQFVWINSSESAFNLQQHPFSILESEENAKTLSFLIRELGDYTRSLDKLKLGQNVFIDGPYGTMTLSATRLNPRITLIAGGVGIAPMISLLRELAQQHDKRAIQLMYADRQLANMAFLDELLALEKTMHNFTLKLFCEQIDEQAEQYQSHVFHGRIDKTQLEQGIVENVANTLGVYLCGPKGMIDSCNKNLKQLGVAANNVHFEQLSF